jgi:IS30 family transposase
MRVGLSHRARNIESRTQFGHWEADSVIGVGCHLHTEVERKTRYLKAMLIPDKSAAATLKAQHAMFAPLPPAACRSVTSDNGSEFAAHAALLESLGALTYFADPYSSWQRGSNENRNGMIRRYLPKGTPISMDMNHEIRMIVDEINNRPMSILDYRTPAEARTDELLESTQPTTVLHL